RCAPCPLVLFVFQLPPPPPFSLFPYTTLCRSSTPLRDHALRRVWVSLRRASPPPQAQPQPQRPPLRWRLQRLLRQSPGSPHRSPDRKSTRLNSSHVKISYAVVCLKQKTQSAPS